MDKTPLFFFVQSLKQFLVNKYYIMCYRAYINYYKFFYLKLNNPIYEPTASYGHFGRIPNGKGHFTWEKIDLVEELKKSF